MKHTALLLAGLFLFVALGSSMAVYADDGVDEGKIIKEFKKELNKLVKECVKELKHAESTGDMDEIAKECDDEVFELLDWLEEELDHEVNFVMFDVCVTNKKLGYTACFDPINVI